MTSPLRVASLLPSATEIVCLLGAGEQLCGISHECDFPPGVTRHPVLTSSKVSLSAVSAAIDADVRRVLEHALAVYDIDTEALRRAAPDVIVTQDLCDVCAVSYSDVERAAREVLGEVEIVNLHPTRLDEVLDDVEKVARALGVPERGARERAELARRMDELTARARAIGHRPRVLTIEWIDPVMIGGTWMPELVERAGGEALVTKPGEHAPTLDRAALEALDPAPDVVLVKPCGFTLERTRAEARTLAAILEGLPWPALEPTLETARVHVADGNAYFNRPGPRLVESLEILAACVHPAEFPDLAERHADSCVPFQRFLELS